MAETIATRQKSARSNRNFMLGGVIGAVVVAAGVGWFFGSRIRSPAEVAAEAQPPPASNITVEVVSTVLSADVIARADVVYDEPALLTLSGSFADQPGRLIVTRSVEQGAELIEGDMAVEVVGRPVFLLVGEIPMYRDLRPGASGDDVLQLEEALVRLGFLAGAADGVWDEATGAAVAAWYEAAGYRANGLSEEDETTLAAARDRVRNADLAVADSLSALSEANRGVGASAILAAEGEVQTARDALALARVDAEWANEDAAAELNAATAALAIAQQELESAEGADPPPSADEMAQLEAEVVVAEDRVGDAQRQVQRVGAEQAALVAQADTQLDVATAALAELRRGPDTSAMSRQVQMAREEATAAREDLAALEAELGTWLPGGELVFLDRLPVRVDQVSVARGSEISGTFLTVTGSDLAFRSAVSEADAVLLEVGMEVEIENTEGDPIPGTISHVADRTGTDGVAADRVYVEMDAAQVPDELIGTNVRVTIPVGGTDGEVLAVPAAALFATADGSTHVEVQDEDGSLRVVEVETGLAAEGLVEITPVDGEVSEGSLVVVGRADGSAPGGDAPDAEEGSNAA